MVDFINKIGDLFLSEDKATRSWLKDKQMVHCWHTIFYITLIWMLFNFIIVNYLDMSNSILHTRIYRIVNLFCFIVWDIIWILLTFFYYNNLLKTGKDLNLINIASLFGGAVLFFSQTYYWLYNLFPYYLEYFKAPYTPGSVVQKLPFYASLEVYGDFLIYSAVNMYNSNYWKIRSVSTYVSFVNLIQSLYGLLFVAIIFSTYVGKQIQGRVNKK